jgi:hypothetical protein
MFALRWGIMGGIGGGRDRVYGNMDFAGAIGFLWVDRWNVSFVELIAPICRGNPLNCD